jgi:hypothetical protein
VLPFPLAGADEANALTAGIDFENPRDLTHIPDRRLTPIHIPIALDDSSLDTLFGEQAVNVDLIVGCALSHDTAMAGVAKPAREVGTGSAMDF